MRDQGPAWRHLVHADADGSYRVEIVDEDEVVLPVGRKLTAGQAEKLVLAIAAESVDSGKPMKTVIRDHAFMAATILTVKRQQI